MKKNITCINDPQILQKIKLLRPSYYQMLNDDEHSVQIGFISQDVEKIFPAIVADVKGIKMMNYAGLIPILTKGMQEQQEQIEILQKENAGLKARLERLEKILVKN